MLIWIIGFILALVLSKYMIGAIVPGSGVGSADVLNTSFSNKSDFVDTIKLYATQYNWDMRLPIVFSAVETGWGKYCYHYNLFKITTKGQGHCDPNVLDCSKHKFRSYFSYSESIRDFWDLLSKDPRYKDAYNNRMNLEECIRLMINAGYSGADNVNTYLGVINRVSDYV